MNQADKTAKTLPAMHECEVCGAGPWGSRQGGYDQGWREAMVRAHHAHAEETYLGHLSANGVLGAGPDAVIVDGDWLEDLIQRADHPVVRLVRWSERITHGIRTRTHSLYLRATCLPGINCRRTEDKFYLNDGVPWCARCGRGLR